MHFLRQSHYRSAFTECKHPPTYLVSGCILRLVHLRLQFLGPRSPTKVRGKFKRALYGVTRLLLLPLLVVAGTVWVSTFMQFASHGVVGLSNEIFSVIESIF